MSKRRKGVQPKVIKPEPEPAIEESKGHQSKLSFSSGQNPVMQLCNQITMSKVITNQQPHMATNNPHYNTYKPKQEDQPENGRTSSVQMMAPTDTVTKDSQEDTGTSPLKREKLQEEERTSVNYDSLVALFADNFCICTGANCKLELTNLFKEFMRQALSRNFVMDLINIVAGSSSKSDKIINILIYFLKYLSLNNISKSILDDMLNLFVMIYLKASRPVQRAVVEDIETIFYLIKERETTLFIDQQFKFKIFFQQLVQFQFCMKQSAPGAPPCEILNPQAQVKKKNFFSSKSKVIFGGIGSKGAPQQQIAAEQAKQLVARQCSVHGCCNIKDHQIDLTATKEKFISYVCMLAQLYFRILKIEDGYEELKEIRRKYLCNLLFSILQNCPQSCYYFPLRALAEFFIEGESEKALGKRLNEECLFVFKQRKDFLGRHQILQDFSKGHVPQQGSLPPLYNYLFADTLSELRKVQSKLDPSSHLDYYLLCLRILPRIINQLKGNEYSQSAISLYIDCLLAIGQKMGQLTIGEQELYYSEIKNLLSIIKQRQKEYQQAKCEPMVDVGEEESKPITEENVLYQNVNGRFVPIRQIPGRSRSALPRQSEATLTKYPNLSVLKDLVSIQSIQRYPRLALLIFDALLPYMEVFDNSFISFSELCQDQGLISRGDFSLLEDKTFEQDLTTMRKRIKVSDGASQGRELLLNFFITYYHKNLVKRMHERQLQPTEVMQGQGMTVQDYIDHLLKLKAQLSREEIIFVIDFLIQICKHCQIFDVHAVSLGTHLLPDLYEKTGKRVTKIVKEESPELLHVNFDLRFNYFIRKFSLYNRMVAQLNRMNQQHHWNQTLPPLPDDELFTSLFTQVFNRLTEKVPLQNPMFPVPLRAQSVDVYATHFLKTIIKILQQNRQYIKLDFVKSIVEKVMYADGKLDVMANSWPLYFVISMFLNSYFNEIEGKGGKSFFSVVSTFFETVCQQLARFREDCQKEGAQPMLRFYQLRNLIYTFTGLMRYLLCFQTPITEKTSSSQLYSNGQHSQQQPPLHMTQSQQSIKTVESPMKSVVSDEDVVIVGEGHGPHELSFIVKKQKRCNFCGEHLPYPKKFTFQRKCKKCSLKNSTFVFPARFLCNTCIEGSCNDIHRVESDQIPLEYVKNAEVLHSEHLVRKLQGLVARTLELAAHDQQDPQNSDLYFNSEVSCFSKLTSKGNLYSQLVTCLLNRMLNIMKQLIIHDIPVDAQVEHQFQKIAANRDRLADVFMLTKERIRNLQMSFLLHKNRMRRAQTL